MRCYKKNIRHTVLLFLPLYLSVKAVIRFGNSYLGYHA